MTSDELLIVITGPTASGKTGLAIRLAKHFLCPIISADSRQFYRPLPIGTAQPDQEEMEGVPHYFMGNLDIHETMSAGKYAQEARNLIQSLFQKYKTIIVCGGTGLYIQALLYGMDEFPPVQDELRNNLNQRYKNEGLAVLVDELQLLDPEFCKSADLQNPQRVLRALEVCLTSGKPFSTFKKQSQLPLLSCKTEIFCLNPDRRDLYRNIDLRVDSMIEKGLEKEAKEMIPYRHLNALNTVGYKEMFQYFDGFFSREEAISLIKQHTRNYAKRQMTWFRKMDKVRFLEGDVRNISEELFVKNYLS
jgi:tRNA dimethylallyltransferase